MKKQITLVLILFILFGSAAQAQFYGGGGFYMQRGYRYRMAPPRQRYYRPKQPPFKPTVNFSIGYGFPNLDKDYLAEFYNAYKGTPTQLGPVTAALDYQFSRYTSIGVMGSYGKVTTPYIDYNSTDGNTAFTGKLENWSVMFNMMSYFPSYQTVSPYIRTAIGVNNWNQDYRNPDGSKAAIADNPTSLAYQVSIGARFNMSPNAGFYIEAGYGKYIASAGLTFRF